MTRYRLLDHIDWAALHRQWVQIEVIPQAIIAVKLDGSLVILAQTDEVSEALDDLARLMDVAKACVDHPPFEPVLPEEQNDA